MQILNFCAFYYTVQLVRCVTVSVAVSVIVVVLRKTVLKDKVFLKGAVWALFIPVLFAGRMKFFDESRIGWSLSAWWKMITIKHVWICWLYFGIAFLYGGLLICKRIKLNKLVADMERRELEGTFVYVTPIPITPFTVGVFRPRIAVEITNSYGSVYQNTCEVQTQQTLGQQAALKTEAKETAAIRKNTGAATGRTTVFRHGYIDENGKYSHIALIRNDFMLNMSDKLQEERRQNVENVINKLRGTSVNKNYLGKLQKQIPSMTLRVGTHIPTANDKRVGTLTVHPGILAQMQNDPEKEKYYTQRMKDIAWVEKMARGAAKTSGSTTEYSHWYIDGEGKIWHTARTVRKDKLNEKLRKQAQVNARKHIAKIRENTRKKTGRISKQKRSFDMRI